MILAMTLICTRIRIVLLLLHNTIHSARPAVGTQHGTQFGSLNLPDIRKGFRLTNKANRIQQPMVATLKAHMIGLKPSAVR